MLLVVIEAVYTTKSCPGLQHGEKGVPDVCFFPEVIIIVRRQQTGGGQGGQCEIIVFLQIYRIGWDLGVQYGGETDQV